MDLLANENVGGPVVEALRHAGHDVQWISESARDAENAEVLRRGVGDERILVTFDRDFGELVFRKGLPAACGVILLRRSAASPEVLAARVVGAIASRTDWPGHFSVIEPGRVRMTPIPR